MDPNGPFIDGLPSYHGLPWFTRVYLLQMAVSSAAMLNIVKLPDATSHATGGETGESLNNQGWPSMMTHHDTWGCLKSCDPKTPIKPHKTTIEPHGLSLTIFIFFREKAVDERNPASPWMVEPL